MRLPVPKDKGDLPGARARMKERQMIIMMIMKQKACEKRINQKGEKIEKSRGKRAFALQIAAFFFVLLLCGVATVRAEAAQKTSAVGSAKASIQLLDAVLSADSSGTVPTGSAVTDPSDVISTGSAITTPTGLTVHFVNVDHGSCTILQCDGQTMVVDGGPLVKYNQATESWTNISIGERAKNYLVALGVQRVEYVVASHPHADHINGLVPVLNTFPVDHVLMPPVDYPGTISTASYRKFLDAVTYNGAPVTYPTVGTEFMLGSAKISVIAPNSDWYEDANNYSIVLRVDYGEKSFLICGDCLKESEAEMMAAGYDLDVDVMTVPHHGIAGVNTYATDHYDFIRAVQPLYAVASKNMVASYPLLSVLRETADVYYTHSSGTVVFHTDGTSFDISMDHGTEPDFYASDILSVDCRDPQMELLSIEKDNPITQFYRKKITLKFSGHYGFHQYTKIETMLVPEGQEFDANGSWVEGSKVVVDQDFAGRVYLRYTNEKGEYIYAVTKGFAVDQTGIQKVIISSDRSQAVRAVKKSRQNRKPITFTKKPVISASAITGVSGIREISYQLVAYGEELQKDGEWIVGDQVKLKRRFNGNVYFKITDSCGRVKIKKTPWLYVEKKQK